MRKALFFMTVVALGLAGGVVILTRNTPERVAYLKTPDRNRVMIFAAVSDGDARAALGKPMWTVGQLTVAYLYAPAAAEHAAAAMQAARPGPLAATEAIETAAPGYLCRLTINPWGDRAYAGTCPGGA